MIKKGRPRIPEEKKRKPILIKLPPELIKMLESIPGTKTGLIEKAIRQTYKINS